MVVHASLIRKYLAAGANEFDRKLPILVVDVNRLLHASIWVDKFIETIITSSSVHAEAMVTEWILLWPVPIVIPEYKTSFGETNEIE